MSDSIEKPVGWVVTMLALAIAWLGWAFVAATYATSEQGWHAGEVTGPGYWFDNTEDSEALGEFLWNSISQIPNCVAVVNFAFTRRLWLVAVFVCLEVGVYLVGKKMRRLEKEFSTKSWRRTN